VSTKPYVDMAARIKEYAADCDWNVKAAANMVADADLIRPKVAGYVLVNGRIDWQALADHVDVSGWSTSEKGMIRLACSLAGYIPEDEGTHWTVAGMLGRLDAGNSRLAVEAVRFAALGPAS
jgi:hypothetical protein